MFYVEGVGTMGNPSKQVSGKLPKPPLDQKALDKIAAHVAKVGDDLLDLVVDDSFWYDVPTTPLPRQKGVAVTLRPAAQYQTNLFAEGWEGNVVGSLKTKLTTASRNRLYAATPWKTNSPIKVRPIGYGVLSVSHPGKPWAELSMVFVVACAAGKLVPPGANVKVSAHPTLEMRLARAIEQRWSHDREFALAFAAKATAPQRLLPAARSLSLKSFMQSPNLYRLPRRS